MGFYLNVAREHPFHLPWAKMANVYHSLSCLVFVFNGENHCNHYSLPETNGGTSRFLLRAQPIFRGELLVSGSVQGYHHHPNCHFCVRNRWNLSRNSLVIFYTALSASLFLGCICFVDISWFAPGSTRLAKLIQRWNGIYTWILWD